MYSTYQQATINLSAYTGMHKIIFVGKTSDLFGQLLDDIVITSYLDKDDSGNTIGGDNTPPVADLSKGEPYTGQVNQDITFDGSNSYDPDGTIVKWWWEFGDGNSSTGEIVTYQYSNPGTYTVTLQVLDDANANATDTATVTIVQGENGPPDAPLVKADIMLPLELNVFELTDPDRSITLFIQANDKDDDMVYFVIDWDDGFSDTTSAVASNAKVTVNHTWVKQGLYKISIIAKDTYDTSSQPTIVTVFLNMYVKKLPTIAGYLVGYTTDGNYSEFYNSNSHNITDMPTDTMDRYLIDYNGDGTPDYTYDDSSGVVAYESEGDQQQDTSTKTPGFEFLIVLSSVLLFIIVRRKRT
jgi:PKD repeat protein